MQRRSLPLQRRLTTANQPTDLIVASKATDQFSSPGKFALGQKYQCETASVNPVTSPPPTDGSYSVFGPSGCAAQVHRPAASSKELAAGPVSRRDRQAAAPEAAHHQEPGGKRNYRRSVRREERREAVKRDILNLFRFKLAQIYVADGFSWGMAARAMGASTSGLCHLNNLYLRGGYDAVAPHLADVFPRAFSMDIFDLAGASVPAANALEKQ